MSGSIVGEEIDGYRIQEVLGRGGMGVVYKAEDVALSRTVALKCLNPGLVDDERFLRRFRSEAQAIARVDSPYIVEIYSLSETEIGQVIAMEYVEGRTLKQDINAGRTSWEESLPIIQQMLTALQHAHDGGVIHRDVKPQNVLLSDVVLAHGVRVKMTDFGLAKINRSGDRSRTVTEGVYGTLHYMSPEQVEGHGDVDHRSDIYSLGMTCYEMLAGQLPFDEESTEYTIMRTIVEGDLPEIGTFAAGVPAEMQDIIMKAVANDPARRFQSAAEMQTALGQLKESSEQGSQEQEPETLSADLDSPVQDPPAQDAPAKDTEVTSSPALTDQVGSLFSGSGWKRIRRAVVLVLLVAGAALGGSELLLPAHSRLSRSTEVDQWIVSRLHTTTQTVHAAIDEYDPRTAARAAEDFAEGLSNRYFRLIRSLRRGADLNRPPSNDDRETGVPDSVSRARSVPTVDSLTPLDNRDTIKVDR